MLQTGLSEVRFFYVPRRPASRSRLTGPPDISLDATLNPRPGREATSHTVYFGADNEAVTAGHRLGQHGDRSQLRSGRHGLRRHLLLEEWTKSARPARTRATSGASRPRSLLPSMISRATTTTRTGFTTRGSTGYATQSSGSTVGHMESPFAEQAIVHGGPQSMPLAYDNTNRPLLQRGRTGIRPGPELDRRWATELCVWIRGYPA